MEIKTKYNIGDEVWFMDANKCVCGKISGFRYTYVTGQRNSYLSTGEEYVVIVYSIDVPKRIFHANNIREENLFSTKEELLKSL